MKQCWLSVWPLAASKNITLNLTDTSTRQATTTGSLHLRPQGIYFHLALQIGSLQRSRWRITPHFNLVACWNWEQCDLGLYSLSAEASYRQMSWNLGSFGFRLLITMESDRHIGSGAAEMSTKFGGDTIIITQSLISPFRDFTRFGGKTFFHPVLRDWNLTGTWAAALRKCLPDSVAIRSL